MPHDLDTFHKGRQKGQKTRPDVTNVKAIAKLAKQRTRSRVAKNLRIRGNAWVFQAKAPGGRSYLLGLGSLDLVSLEAAKAIAADMRRAIANGDDPRMVRQAKPSADRTVKALWEAYIVANRAAWRSAKTAKTWDAQGKAYVFPVIGGLPIERVTTEQVKQILDPIWSVKTVVAEQVRGRLERVWNAAKAAGHCSGQNPAQWAGHLSTMLPAPNRVHQERNHASLPFEEIGRFMLELRATDGLAARGLEFAILTGGRSDEARSARWSEIDLDAAMWRIPAGRMKGGAAHAVPLSPPVVALLRGLPRYDGNDYVFAKPDGQRFGKNAMLCLLATFKRSVMIDGVRRPITVHGFRSTHMMWGQLCGKFPQIILDMGLAHKQDDKVLAAYLRANGKTLDGERVRCLCDWAAYCNKIS